VSAFQANLAANVAGTATLALVQLACVPVYVHFLGIEGFGLIGLFVTLQATLRVFDLGLSPTITREMARLSAQPERNDETRDLLRTVEAGYWAVGLLVGASVCAAAPLIANHWIKVDTLPVEEATQAVTLMGCVIAAHWPISLYQGALTGLQRQVELNAIRIMAAIAGAGGAIIILWKFSPSVSAFFAWQIVACLLEVLLLGVCLWWRMPAGSRGPRFNVPGLLPLLPFAGGMGGIALSGMILMQMDKIILSGLLPLDMFGYYTVAGLVANSLHLFIGPVFAATYPRLCAMVATGRDDTLPRIYHEASQIMAVLVLPLAVTVAYFASDVLRIWTGNSELAGFAAPMTTLLIAGTAINGLMFLPFPLQLTYGWTSLPLGVSVAMCAAAGPAFYLMGLHFGGTGAAAVWLALNVLNLVIAAPLTHRRLLVSDGREWILRDIAPPLIASLTVVWVARSLPWRPESPIAGVGFLGIVVFVSMVLATASAARLRAMAWHLGAHGLLRGGRRRT
jgi:O-antigen/teichoic acid export membrane protein